MLFNSFLLCSFPYSLCSLILILLSLSIFMLARCFYTLIRYRIFRLSHSIAVAHYFGYPHRLCFPVRYFYLYVLAILFMLLCFWLFYFGLLFLFSSAYSICFCVFELPKKTIGCRRLFQMLLRYSNLLSLCTILSSATHHLVLYPAALPYSMRYFKPYYTIPHISAMLSNSMRLLWLCLFVFSPKLYHTGLFI